jgi:hypothetical protein
MLYSKSVLLYEDKPASGFLFIIMMFVLPLAFLASSIYLWSTGETEGSFVLLVEAFIVLLIFYIVFPKKFQVYDNHLRIVLGGPFSIKIGFDQISSIEATNRFALTINFVTKITKERILINRKKGMSFAITPRNNTSFLEHANQAIAQWSEQDRNNNGFR